MSEDILQEFRDRHQDRAASAAHQEIAEKIRDKILDRNSRTGAKEVKKFEVSSLRGSPLTFVVVEVGMENDEGTLASLWCRDYRHVVIGPRGGVTLLNAKNQLKKKGWWNIVYAGTK